MVKAGGDSPLFGLPGHLPATRLPDVPSQLLQFLSPGMVVTKPETGMSALQNHFSRVGSAAQHAAQECLRGFFEAEGRVSVVAVARLAGANQPRCQTRSSATIPPRGPP